MTNESVFPKGPEPQSDLEEVMRIIWESESKHNTWRDLIWNDFPLSDRDAKKIYERLKKAAIAIQNQFPNGYSVVTRTSSK